MLKTRALHLTIRGLFVFLLAGLLGTIAASDQAAATSNLAVTPSSITFPTTPVGGFSYDTVTISNTGDTADYLVTATASPDPPFFPTFGGTCNTSIDPNGRTYWIPAGGSCTFQWGYHPTTRPGKGRPPWTQTGTGTLFFDSGTTLAVSFTGQVSPH